MEKTQSYNKTYIFLVSFILLYILDGSVSVFEEFWTLVVDDNNLLFKIRSSLAYFVIIACGPYIFVVFLSNISNRHKYLVAPLFLSALGWISLLTISMMSKGMRPEEIFTMQTARHLSFQNNFVLFIISVGSSLAQTAVGIFSLKMIITNFENRSTQLPYLVLRGFAAMGLITFATIFYFLPQILAIPVLIENSTKGYLTLQGTSVMSVQREFSRDGRVVKLVPMVHIGDKKFYRSLNQNFDHDKKTLFLLEGISDKKNLLNGFSHKKTADKVGLETQNRHFNPTKGKAEYAEKNIHFKVADISSSDMNPETIGFLQKPFNIMDIIAPEGSVVEQRKLTDFVTSDITIKRNDNLMKIFDENFENYDVIIIPWGAMHIPYFEEELLKRNFVQSQKTVPRVVFSLLKALSDRP